MFSPFLNGNEMFWGIECQQAVFVAETEKIRNFAGALTWFIQDHLQHLKKQNHGTYVPYEARATEPRHLVLWQEWIVGVNDMGANWHTILV